MLKRILIFCAGFAGLAVFIVIAAYLGLVIFSPGSQINRESIKNILSRQSPVYYSDGETVMGVFFRNSHRLYVPYERIPDNFIQAIIAAEDHEFFSHQGIDIPGIIRALIANIRAGRIVQGGSTITQQTAKNLFKRQERSLRAKLKELLYALRLEHRYTKEDIFTFYANQFYVSGNGRGLGVAARYYFDKEVSELTLIESAFIAGSVKGPNYYNPFTKRDPRDKETARQRAKNRTSYVLKKMHSLDMIDSSAYKAALEKDIPFNQGRMRFPLNTVMDMVEEGLNDERIRRSLAEHGIDNVATSGIRVVTTIDREMQDSVVRSLRHTLSRLDIRLSGYDREEVRKKYAGLSMSRVSKPVRGDFLLGRVTGIEREEPRLEAALAEDGGISGILSEEGLRPALKALVKYERQRWSEPGKGDWALLLDQIEMGDLIYVSVRGYNDETDQYELVLQKYPELQGGALVIRDGLIKGLIGGYDNFYFNRAVQAKRPMGSTFKAPLYAAAIQLGWNSLDLLDNRRRNFVYQNRTYIPKPDHHSPYDKVSMSWAGVKSENVASIWLLYNLCNHLTPAQFKDLLGNVGMAREQDESYYHYKRRVRDTMGIVVDESALERTAFYSARSLCKADLAFAGREDERDILRRFVYSDQLPEPTGNVTGREAEVRREVAAYTFERFRALRDQLRETAAGLDLSGDILVNNLYIRHSPGKDTLSEYDYMEALAESEYIFVRENPGDKWDPVRRSELLALLSGMNESASKAFWNAVRLDNLLSLETVNIVDHCLREELERLKRYRPYSPEVLHGVPDFRLLAGLKYVIGLCRSAGVDSALNPVLSFPLGSNVVSLYELIRLYEGIITGEVRECGPGADPGFCLISRIIAPNGEVIYAAASKRKKITDPRTALEVTDILKNVVSYGTGRYAGGKVRISEDSSSRAAKLLSGGLQVPLFGKTGTADNYTNSAFVGAVPGPVPSGNSLTMRNPDIVGVYLGYDDNSPMIRTSTHITGSSGALRVWTQIAMDIVSHKGYADELDFIDLAFAGAEKVPLHYPDLDQINVPVDRESGLPLPGGGNFAEIAGREASVTTFGEMYEGGGLKLERRYQPYWVMEGNR